MKRLAALLLLTACAPAPVPPAPIAVESRDYSRSADLTVKALDARRDGDHLLLSLAIADRAGAPVDLAPVKAFFRDSAGRDYQALRLESIAAIGPVTVELDMAFAAEGPGAVRLEGLAADPIPITWTKPPRVIPPEAKVHRGFDLVFGALGALVLLAGWIYIQSAAGNDPYDPASPP